MALPPRIMRLSRRLRGWLSRRGYHLIFAAAILSLAALILWWSVFLRASIHERLELQLDNLQRSATVVASQLGSLPTEPSPGPLMQDERLELVSASEDHGEYAVVLSPNWSVYAVAPRAGIVEALEDDYHRHIFMVTGESSTLLIVVLICIFMLWRMMRLERRAARQLHEFWGRVTHELKTPITGVKAFLQTLQSREFSREELSPLVKLALREVERQEMLAENLLLGQRMDHKGIAMDPHNVKVAGFVRDFIDEHRIILPDENLRLEVECDENVVAIADTDALRVILENLTDNALKYGGKQPELTYRIAADSRYVTVTISDKGLGFKPANANQIFEAYQRLSEEQPQGKHGTGMGLYISRKLARRMGGDLVAQSEGANKGASFIITLRRTGKV